MDQREQAFVYMRLAATWVCTIGWQCIVDGFQAGGQSTGLPQLMWDQGFAGRRLLVHARVPPNAPSCLWRQELEPPNEPFPRYLRLA